MLEDKIYGERVRRFTGKMERVLYDAYRRMEEERAKGGLRPPMPEDVAVLSGPREWPDTTRQGTTVIDVVTDRAYMYEDGEFVREREGSWKTGNLTGDARA
jgi:hypothetical protein